MPTLSHHGSIVDTIPSIPRSSIYRKPPLFQSQQSLWLLRQQLPALTPIVSRKSRNATRNQNASECNYELIEERGVQFTPGTAFYRAESAQARDLAILAAAVYKQQHGQLRVLDVMAGSGMRGARYLTQAGADLVWCNDYDTRNKKALVYNLVSALKHNSSSSSSSNHMQQQQQLHQSCGGSSFQHVQSDEEGRVASSSNSSSGGSNGSSSSNLCGLADRWCLEADILKYEGIRGDVLQWTTSSSSSSSDASSCSDMQQGQRPDHDQGPLTDHQQQQHLHHHQQQQQQQQHLKQIRSQQPHQQQQHNSLQHQQQQQEEEEQQQQLSFRPQPQQQQQQQQQRLTCQPHSHQPQQQQQRASKVQSLPQHQPQLQQQQQPSLQPPQLQQQQQPSLQPPQLQQQQQLASQPQSQPHKSPPQQHHQQQQCRVSYVDARRLLCSTYLQEDYYDLVDVDSFGSDTSWLAAAVAAVRFGGMIYITSTDGFCSSGKRPERSLAAYGSYLRALPHANEQGLRMLIGAAVKEAAAQGMSITPLFCLYSYHGPVFRVMLRAEKGGGVMTGLKDYGFVGHCFVHGENKRVGWRGLSQAWCRCAASGDVLSGRGSSGIKSSPTPLVLSGPMWTGPLHDQDFISAMRVQASQWDWTGSGVPPDSPHMIKVSKNNKQKPLELLLDILQQEADPHLPPWYICISTLAQQLNTTPSRDKLIAALRARGFAACLCHVENRAMRTNSTTQQVLQIAVDDCGYSYRQPTATLQGPGQQQDLEPENQDLDHQ